MPLSSSPGCELQNPLVLGANQVSWAPRSLYSSVPGFQTPYSPSPQPARNRGQSSALCQVLFILFPQKHLVRGQLLGGSHDTAAGVVRHGTVRHGTGSLRVAQSTADTHTVTMFRGSAPGTAPAAGNRTRRRTALCLRTSCPLLPWPADCHKLGRGPGLAGGVTGPWSQWVRRQGGRCAWAARWAPAGVLVPRAMYTLYRYLQREERGARRRHTQAMHLSPVGRGGGCAQSWGSPLWGCPVGPPSYPRPTAAGLSPSLGHRHSPL